jgi:hypothetical protein
MKQAAFIVLSSALVAATSPARTAAQLPGMPVWNSPRSGTGVFIAGDVGIPDSSLGKGTTIAGRAALGLSALTLSATVGVRNPSGAGSSVTEYGGTAAYRLIGGSLIPISINLQGGFASWSDSVTSTRGTAAIGLAIDLPIPGISFEPWVAPGLRVNHRGASGPLSSETNTEFGVAGGLTFGLGLIGLHGAVDYEKLPGGGHTTTLGVGLHVDIKPSLGL